MKPRRASKLSLLVSLIPMVLCLGLLSPAAWAEQPASRSPRNVVLLIGDGMGPGIVEAAGFYANGKAGTLSFEQLPYKALLTTTSVGGDVTDSAAAATAMATGHKVENGVISVAVPGDERDLKTVLELAAEKGKKTGLITTKFLEDATPAAFAAHVSGRKGIAEIAEDFLNRTRPNLILGAYAAPDAKTNKDVGLSPGRARQAGYTVVTTRQEMQALAPGKADRVAGLFARPIMPFEHDRAQGKDGRDVPHLSEMAIKALEILSAGPDGFFLMVEAGTIDTAGHSHQTERAILEAVEFDRTTAAVLAWARGRDDTLVIVTADHDTGSMKVESGADKGQFPTVTWTAKSHTKSRVGLWAWGVGAEAAALAVDNTDVFKLMTGTLNENTAGKPAGKAAGKAGKTTEESKAKKPRKAA